MRGAVLNFLLVSIYNLTVSLPTFSSKLESFWSDYSKEKEIIPASERDSPKEQDE